MENLPDDRGIIDAKRDELIDKINYCTVFWNAHPTVQGTLLKEYWEKNIPVQSAIKAQQVGIDASQIRTNGWVIFEGADYYLRGLTWPKELDKNRNIAIESRKYDDLLDKINKAQTEDEVEKIDITQIKEIYLPFPRSSRNLITAKNTRKSEISSEITKALTRAKAQAKVRNVDGTIWDLPLTFAEIKQIEDANDLNELNEIQRRFKVIREELEKVPKPKKDEIIPFPDPEQPLHPKKMEVWGHDFLDLKINQQQRRKKVVEGWIKKDYKDQENKRESVCSGCQKAFPWDINLTLNSARKKAKKELIAHQKVCSLMLDSEKAKKVLEENWQALSQSSHIHNAYSCRKCWGKIYWDKNIPEAVKSKSQAIADLVYHEKHECSTELTKPKIAIYFSPNKGGDEHAPIKLCKRDWWKRINARKSLWNEITTKTSKPKQYCSMNYRQ